MIALVGFVGSDSDVAKLRVSPNSPCIGQVVYGMYETFRLPLFDCQS